jgi:Tfp pilus assembly protein PilN
MINFLPPKQKEELLKEERFKLVLILGIIVFANLISFLLILFSIKIFLASQLEIQKIFMADREKELKASQVEELEKKIEGYNLNFSKLSSFYRSQIKFPDILEKISKNLPAEAYLTSFNFASNKISLSGFCPDRERLLEFKDNLEEEESFKEIYFPPQNWVEKTDINFSVNFSYGSEK